MANLGTTVHFCRDMDPREPKNMSILLAFELTQASPQSFRMNDGVFENMRSMLATLDTSHLETSVAVKRPRILKYAIHVLHA